MMKQNKEFRSYAPAVIPTLQSALPRLPQEASRQAIAMTDRRIVSAACSIPNWLSRTVRH